MTRHETTDQKKARRAATARNKVAQIRDRRRFKLTPVPTGDTHISVPLSTLGTIFPRKVTPVTDENVLKDGANNSKIGGDVRVGKLRGAKIFTLTLEERATCPKTCALWQTCYGNSMQFSKRWEHGPVLERKLAAEIADLCAKHDTVLVRLHVLGDFYSVEYVGLWARLLQDHPGLHVFGFTAWDEISEIGTRVALVRKRYGKRFSIRHSGRGGKWGSFTVDFPTEKRRIGSGIVCPEQRAAMSGTGTADHCGACGLCWAISDPIVFVEH